MTPAKLLALMDRRMDRDELQELPIAALRCTYANFHRDPGDSEKGIPPAPQMPMDDFRIFKRSRNSDGSLVNKDVPAQGGSQNWAGARANRKAFEDWSKGRSIRLVRKE